MTLPAAGDGLAGFLAAPIHRHRHDVLAWRVWELRSNLTPYDASYVALAESLGTVLLTTDERIAGAPGLRCEVEVAGQ